MALTRDDIWAVADRLDAEGKAPTLAAVRKALGSGSFTTISEAMREWHQHRKEKASKMQEAGPMPPDMDDVVRRFAQEVWTKASELARAEAAKIKEAFVEAQREWERERRELEAVAEDLQDALNEGQLAAEESKKAFDDLAERYANAEASAILLKESVKEMEGRIEELRKENERLHELLRQVMTVGAAEKDHGRA